MRLIVFVFLTSLFALLVECMDCTYTHKDRAKIFGIRRMDSAILRLISLTGGAHEDDEPSGRPKKKKGSAISNLAKKSFSLTGKAFAETAKHSGKAAYWAVRPKSVELKELVGLWRIDQQVVLFADERPIETSANIEMNMDSVFVVIDGDRIPSSLKFTPARFPLSASVEFMASAFQVDGEEKPLLFFYKGQIHRKLADKSVLKIKGKIYRITRTGFRGKTIKYVPVGTFVARKRIRLEEEEDESYNDEDDGFSEWEDDEPS